MEKRTLFDDAAQGRGSVNIKVSSTINREVQPLDRLKNLEEKITAAVERVKALKEEKLSLERKIRDLEAMLDEKNVEIEALKSEKKSVGSQIEELLNELETIET